GGSWSAANAGQPDTATPRALAIDPTSPSTLYAVVSGSGIYKSADGGGSWTPINTGLTNLLTLSLAIDPATPTTIYAGAESSQPPPSVVFKSTDGGATWNEARTGIPNTAVLALAVDPTSSSTVYAGTPDGVYKTTDGAASWAITALRRQPPNTTWISALAIDPAPPTTVYATVESDPYGVFKSTEGGTNWVNTGLSFRYAFFGLAIDPTDHRRLYAATFGGGVFVFTPVCGHGIL